MEMNFRADRRRLITAAAGWSLAAADARAQDPARFPQRSITMLVPWPAGGATDVTLRLLADLASRTLGQKVLIENRPGASGTLAMPVLQQAAPDGYTIAQLPQPVYRAPLVQKLLWDPIRDTTPIIQISGVTFGVLVAASSPFKSLDDLFDYARSHPGALTIATNGVGTTPHEVMDELFSRKGLAWIHVPYKGTSEQMVAVSSGQVMAGVNSNGFAPMVDSGRLRLLVTFGAQRSRHWPQVPTLKELGYGIVANSPYGLVGPRGMASDVVQTLHDAFKRALFDPAHVAALERFDQEPAYLGPEDYGRAMRAAFAAEKRAVAKLGVARPS
ncbi:MAG: tripartite tricarboxylate transporter substrate binding protein [Burkholderiales bacterium]|nr:tripartite tricarboxylate transporter substrate binding protein [Burkholderiales bacterium]